MIHVDKNRESDNACSSNSVKNHAREGIITNTFYNMRYTISKPVYDVTDNIKKNLATICTCICWRKNQNIDIHDTSTSSCGKLLNDLQHRHSTFVRGLSRC